ncbi:MAG: PspC domain-containing protein [Candidatus Acidiferrales bacterium]
MEEMMNCPNCQRDITNYSNFCYFCGARQGNAAGSPAPPRRLHRSAIDSKIGGVCGGMAEYFGMDSTLVRLLWVMVTFFTGIIPGLLVYVAAWLIMPEGGLPIPVQPVTQATEAPRASA